MKTRAAVCYQFGQPLVVEEVALEPPQAGEVMVKLAACAICHSDIHYMEGAWGGALPAVYGHEAAGIVQATGSGVTSVAPGTPVVVSLLRSCGQCYYCRRGESYLCEHTFALDGETRLHTLDGQPLKQGLRTGAFAEHVVVDASQVAAVPADMPLDSASLLACGVITGLGAVVNTAQVPAGSSVVVIGAGGVGLNAIQGARLSRAEPVIALDLLPAKLEDARLFGAGHTLDARGEDVPAAVRALTGGRGADYVFVTVGSSRAIEQGLALVRPGGTLVIVGMPAYGDRVSLEASDFAGYGQRILGSKMGSTRLQEDIPRLVALYQAGDLLLDQLITARYPLEAINQAITAVRQGAVRRNVILF